MAKHHKYQSAVKIYHLYQRKTRLATRVLERMTVLRNYMIFSRYKSHSYRMFWWYRTVWNNKNLKKMTWKRKHDVDKAIKFVAFMFGILNNIFSVVSWYEILVLMKFFYKMVCITEKWPVNVTYSYCKFKIKKCDIDFIFLVLFISSKSLIMVKNQKLCGVLNHKQGVEAQKHPINHHYKEYQFFISWSNHQMYQCHFYILIVSSVPSISFLFLYQTVMIYYILMQHKMNLFDICCNIFFYHYSARWCLFTKIFVNICAAKSTLQCDISKKEL